MPSYDVVTSVSEADTDELWPLDDRVFPDQTDYAGWRSGIWDRHAARDGFRLARAHDGGALVGFAYGYTGERGQWWTDQAAGVLTAEVAAEWLGGHFELVSLGVLADARGAGIGGGLLDAVTHGLPHERWLLMATADADDPARHLYARKGWQVIGPGLRDGQVILGRRRPTDS